MIRQLVPNLFQTSCKAARQLFRGDWVRVETHAHKTNVRSINGSIAQWLKLRYFWERWKTILVAVTSASTLIMKIISKMDEKSEKRSILIGLSDYKTWSSRGTLTWWRSPEKHSTKRGKHWCRVLNFVLLRLSFLFATFFHFRLSSSAGSIQGWFKKFHFAIQDC